MLCTLRAMLEGDEQGGVVRSPGLIRGSTTIYLFAFQTKGSLFNNISNLVNIGTVRVPSRELGDVFINPGALYSAAVFIGRWCFLSLVSPEQVGGLSAKISARFLNQLLKVPPNFSPDDRCPCPRNQLSHAWSVKHLLFLLLFYLLRLGLTNPHLHVGNINSCPSSAPPALSVEQLIFFSIRICLVRLQLSVPKMRLAGKRNAIYLVIH